MRNGLFAFLSAILTFAQLAYADLYTDTLPIGYKSKTLPADAGLQSGRYQLKQGKSEQIIYPSKKKSKSPEKSPASEAPPIPYVAPIVETYTQSLEPSPQQEPTLKEQVVDIISGGRKKVAEIYREQIHLDDVRMNKIEVDLGTGFSYNSAKANYAYRSYYSFAPLLSLGAKVWLTPLLGISGKYQSTYGEDVAATNNSFNRVPVKSEWIEFSIDIRKFYGYSRRANNLQYGLLYSELKMNPPADDATRARIKSAGFGVYVDSRFPVAPSYAWTLGGELYPILTHSENATGINLQSGSSVSSSRIGVKVGGEFKLSRQNQMIWHLGIKVERNQFAGSANLTDPESGTIPSGVSVTNTWTFLQLGYRWGQ